ncbi:uncharacterized protein [Linepithema humile]|uniref:uncharacterized protein n=1 Tax=Linepithema humile TaxID=83485 RepID=UPI00351DCA49
MCVIMSDDNIFIELTTRDLLKTWNLEQYASAFESNCIETAEFESLLEPEWKETLESLIPLSGHRMRFVKNLKTFIKDNTNEMEIDENNFTKIREKDKSKKTVIPLSLQLNISNESEDIQEIEEIPKNNNQEKNLEESIHQEASKNIFKKRKRESDECNVTRGEQLRFLLNKSATGRCFLQLAKQGSYLKDKDRNKLTDIIIENQLSKCDKISPTEFTELVGAIQYLFPQEDSELYYIPYKYINGNKLLVKGKLITKYYSIRKEFKALGIIASKSKDQSDS